jgi:hypothetical protein
LIATTLDGATAGGISLFVAFLILHAAAVALEVARLFIEFLILV